MHRRRFAACASGLASFEIDKRGVLVIISTPVTVWLSDWLGDDQGDGGDW